MSERRPDPPPPAAPLSPRLQRKRDEILDAAARAFREDGYDATSMDRIAEVAGASKRTVYNHFGSKEALFQAVFERLLDEMHALKRVPYDAEAPLADQLARFARAKCRFAEDPAWLGLLRVVLAVFVHHPELVVEAMARAQEGEQALEGWLAAATADGRLAVADPRAAAEIFWALVSGALFWPQAFLGPLPPARRDALVAEVVETFLARHRPPRPA